MMPYCDHQNWLQHLMGRHCWRVARHLHHDSKTWTSINACDKHEGWYRAKLKQLGVKP
ncbi:MAG TPA: hypothetical protein VH234_06140 [Candidatus Saccharimonadales bacterium]|jgi:hypothetical protein|nr:hypothetical protein [Candidatus Saccharimonadales bacterium]